MQIDIEVSARPEAYRGERRARYLCVLRREAGASSWACSVHEEDAGGARVARASLAVELGQLLPAVRELLGRVQPGASLMLRPKAEPELELRLALACARERGWRAERCLSCMGSGMRSAACGDSADARCVLCAGHGMRYSRPDLPWVGIASDVWSTQDFFALALGAEEAEGELQPRALAG
jgi:hypothetical protein